MKKLIRNMTETVTGLMLALFAGAPAVADDTEILLVDPNDVQPKPNILFIVDSSGSMTKPQDTKRPYDADDDYSSEGNCESNMLYWTEVDAVPSCDESNTQRIAKSAYLCAAAERQLTFIGLYADTMVQYRTGSPEDFSVVPSTDEPRWQQLEPGNYTAPVECKKDRGEHSGAPAGDLSFGDGGLYPQAGGGVEPYTSDVANEIS